MYPTLYMYLLIRKGKIVSLVFPILVIGLLGEFNRINMILYGHHKQLLIIPLQAVGIHTLHTLTCFK